MKLSTSLSLIKGVGPKTSAAFEDAGLKTAEDLIMLLPRRYDDFSGASTIDQLEPGNVVIKARCESISTRIVRRGMKITTATLVDGSGKVKAIWFNQPYREQQLKPDKTFLFTGKFGLQGNQYQITNPSVELSNENLAESTSDILVPVYRQIKNIQARTLKSIMKSLRPLIEFIP